MPAIRRGAERAGRSLDGFDVTVGFPAVVTRDDSGIEKSKGLVMMFATALDSAPSYLDSVKAAGFGRRPRRSASACVRAIFAGRSRSCRTRWPRRW